MAARHRALIADATFLFGTSATQYLREWFSSDQVLAALGWHAINDSTAGPSTPGTAYVLLHDHASEQAGGGIRKWGFVRGGIGRLPEAMADAAREAGAEIRTEAPVERILVEGGRATGVLLADGEEIRGAPRALQRGSEDDPAAAWSTRRSSPSASRRRSTPTAARARASRSTSRSTGCRWRRRSTARRQQPYHGGIAEINPTVAQMDAAQAEARAGRPATDPHIELCVPTVHDPSLAPEGKHVVTIDVNSQPYTLAEGSWDDIRDEVADRAIAKLGELLPEPAGLDPRAPGSRAARPRARPRDLGRPCAARRDGVRPALQPAPGPRLGRVPHPDPRPLDLRGGHPPRRRRDRRERPQLRARGHSRSARTARPGSAAAGEPLYPTAWDEIEAPSATVSPPGPRSREILGRIERTAYPGLTGGLAPFALAAKNGWTVTDADGNVYLDCASASASVPLGAGRAGDPRAGDRGAATLRQRGHPCARLQLTARARRAPAGRRAATPHPLRHRPERHRGGRDRDQDDAQGDRAADHHRLPRLLPRRVDHDGGARRRGRRDRQRPARAGARLYPRALPAPLPHALPRSAPGWHAATRRSTTCATTSSSTRSTPPTSLAS